VIVVLISWVIYKKKPSKSIVYALIFTMVGVGITTGDALALELHERVNPAITKDTSIFLIGITYSSSEIFIDQAKPRS
jgi:drug/metabolite transporter (DMT)-like permease